MTGVNGSSDRSGHWCRQFIGRAACPPCVCLDGESFASPVLEAADKLPHMAVAKRCQRERRFRAAVAARPPASRALVSGACPGFA
jgi:hypothetical protein